MSILFISLLVVISIAAIIYLTSILKLNAFVSLLLVSIFLSVTALPDKDIIKILKDGFGNTMASIGFLIVFGAIIAIILEKSGAALSIANYMYSKTGKEKATAAMGITGFLAGLPIFCDSGYIILSGLAKFFSARSKIAMPFIASVMASSLYIVHCMVPTHPGILAASDTMGVNTGYLILAGIVFSIPGIIAAYFWCQKITKGINYEPVSIPEAIENKNTELPSVGMSLLPIITPLFLITISSILTVLGLKDENTLIKFFHFIGQPIIALLIGAVSALFLLKNKKIKDLNSVFETAVEKAGPILIVTAAGGMFGSVIKETGVGEFAGNFLGKTGLGLFIPFLIAAFMKTAQGSSTVAVIATASFTVPMLPQLGLDSDTGRLFATLSMGVGSMLLSHANDSYFWVVTKFSDIKTDDSLKVFSTSTLVMSLVTILCVWVTSLFIL